MNAAQRSNGTAVFRFILPTAAVIGAFAIWSAPARGAQILTTVFWGGSGGLGSVDQFSFPGGASQGSLITYPSTAGGSFGASGIALAPNGSFYVGLEQPGSTSDIVHYNANGTVASTQLATSNANVNGGGGIFSTGGVRIGPDGNVYASDIFAGEVFEFNGTTGAYIATPISGLPGAFSGSLTASGIAFDSQGNFYVGEYGIPPPGGSGGEVFKATYNSITQTYTQVGTPFVALGSGPVGSTLTNVDGLLFLPNGKLLVADQGSSGANILEYNSDGSFDTVFASLAAQGFFSPGNMVFTPNGQDILISALGFDDPSTTGAILEYDLNGNHVATLASGLAGPTDFAVVPEPSTWALAAIGGFGLLLLAARRRRSQTLAPVRVAA